MASGSIRSTDDPKHIFEMILRSLEVHRAAKTEQDLVEALRDRFGLSPLPQPWRGRRERILESWPTELIELGVEVDEFLRFLLDQLSAFVEMVRDIYRFLHAHVATTGGRTEHFRIDSDDLSEPWPFDTSRFPHEVEWIRYWADVRIERVEVDWEKVGKLLVMDGGIFYGRVDDERVIQSLIVGRRDGILSPGLVSAGDEIRALLLEAVCAWYQTEREERSNGGSNIRSWQLGVAVHSDLLGLYQGTGLLRNGDSGRIGIDLGRLCEHRTGGYTARQVISEFEESRDLGRPSNDHYVIGSAAFFCALWGLVDPDFKNAANCLRVHEENLLNRESLARRGEDLVEKLLEALRGAITPITDADSVRQLREKQIEILLLPYWKDRWFLYEVWTLLQPLRKAQEVRGAIELLGTTEIEDPAITGVTWNLPTQKARRPVARLSSNTAAVLVWFQRETRRLDSSRNMEPDIRLTLPWEPYVDLAIIECKDRVRFEREGMRVAERYLRGSSAQIVCVVNYEEAQGRRPRVQLNQVDGREYGIVAGLRPGAKCPEFEDRLARLLDVYAGLPGETAPVVYPTEIEEIDVTLTWGDEPRDLDLHVWVSREDGTWHVHYPQEHKGQLDAPPFAELDVDMQDGNGRETVKVLTRGLSALMIAVYNFSADASLSASNAEVIVAFGQRRHITFSVPPHRAGRWWTVAEYDHTMNKLDVINLLSDESPEGRAPYQ